ncbi:MAG: ribonuclease HII [Alphaproteobacteria bacterium]|nr:MAG: ribonuclease HII [Alphaproteobacteria bacterium]
MSPQPGADSLLLFDTPPGPDFSVETRLHRRGLRRVAGVDEAGRGPLAGPVVAAAVILDPIRIPDGLDDSKKLTRLRRQRCFEAIMASAAVAWASMPAAAIDRINIRQATLAAMARAVAGLAEPADAVLIDGRDVPRELAGAGRAMVGGDAASLSIAAASIVAKVVRDRLMAQACQDFPGYGFSDHAGYATPAHIAALHRLGPCPLHRLSFAPVRLLAERDCAAAIAAAT